MESTELYIANLSQYVGGNIIGDWFPLPVSWSTVVERIQLDGSEEYGEEWIILDWENPYGLPISEYSNINELNEYVQRLEDLDTSVLENLSSILSYGAESLQDILDNRGDNYIFTHENDMEDVAREFVESCGGIEAAVGKDNVEFYVAFDKLGRELEINGNYFEGNDGKMIEFVG